jgi:hypothetical protein
MNIQKKQEMQTKFDHTNFACNKALRHSRAVADFRVLTKKEFDEVWSKKRPADGFGNWLEVRKTHKYVGVLTLVQNGVYLHYATSHNDPIFAAAIVLKHSMAKYEGDRMYNKLMRVHQKFFKVILAPKG